MTEAEKVTFELARSRRLEADRLTLDSLWQEIAELTTPRKADIQRSVTPGSQTDEPSMYDGTAHSASLVLAAGCMTSITPGTDRWFAYSAPAWLPAGAGAQWYDRVTEITMAILAGTNFYTAIHEGYLDRNDFGTMCLYGAESRRAPLYFKAIKAGSYTIAEDDEGYVDTVYRNFEMTARQAAQMFGEENLGPQVKECLTSSDSGQIDRKFKFVHCVHPRADYERDRSKRDGKNKPIASIYICVEDCKIVREGGFDEMPYAVGRYLKRNGSAWGYGPGEAALPTIRQVNFLEEQMDVLAEVAANPRILIPDNLVGQVDLRAGGQTIFDRNAGPQGLPQEWLTNGRYDIGKDRIEDKRRFIRACYHNDLFQMFADIDPGKLTATEASLREAEKVNQFSPTFNLLTNEVLTPMMGGVVFNTLLRGGYFPPPPPDIIVAGPNGPIIAKPEVAYLGRMALAIKNLQDRAFMEVQMTLAGPAQMDPTILDNFNMDRAARGIASNKGYPVDWMRTQREVDEIRAARAQAAEAAAAVEQAQGVAKAAKDISQADPGVRNRLGQLAMGAN